MFKRPYLRNISEKILKTECKILNKKRIPDTIAREKKKNTITNFISDVCEILLWPLAGEIMSY